jgi:predicted Zn-dependent protease
MSRVELYERIRKDSRDEGLGIRALAERQAPALGPWTTLIRPWLVADLEAPRKQRHTARRVHQRLVAEYGANVAESTVRAFVARVNLELDNSLRRVTGGSPGGRGS